jgi:hypothetical protein
MAFEKVLYKVGKPFTERMYTLRTSVSRVSLPAYHLRHLTSRDEESMLPLVAKVHVGTLRAGLGFLGLTSNPKGGTVRVGIAFGQWP